jgi:diguanylate cyclase (GGDEF)-like protein/PAS domain S-box-containing protein
VLGFSRSSLFTGYSTLLSMTFQPATDLREILDQTLEVVWLLDPAQRHISYINAAFERVWGRSVDELLLSSDPIGYLRSTIHPDDRDRFSYWLEWPHAEEAPWEFRILRPTGDARWIRARLRPYGESHSGQVIGICQDITEFKRHEEQLEAHRQELEEAYARLQEAVVTDPLTGLKNRRGLQAGFDRLEMDARRHQTPISVVAIDIDHFKTYNDTYGHPAGDTVLVAISTLVQRTLRPTDLAARVGGEEFVVVLQDTDAPGAIAAAERIRKAITQARWPHRPVTASFGVSTWTLLTDRPMDTILEEADRALYHSKHHGRNRVSHIEDMPISQE